MELRNKLRMCRLCLSENECFINIFQSNDFQGSVAAEVIYDLLQFQVSKTDCYPHVVCLTCLTKLTDFKLFKEFCQKSKVTYDKMFILSNTLVMHQPQMDIGEVGSGLEFCEEDPLRVSSSDGVGEGGSGFELCLQDPLKEEDSDPIIKPEELDIDSSVDGSDEPFEGTNTEVSFGPISLKDEVVSFNGNSQTQILEQAGSYCASSGAFDVDSCTRTISTNDESIFKKSKSTSISVMVEEISSETMERSEGAGERICKATLYQQDVNFAKERGREEEVKEEGEGERLTCPEKGVTKERERFECYHCGNLLKTKVCLKRHMVLHGFGKSYCCEVCGKGFQSNANRIQHMRLHTGYKPYKCAECSKCFTKKDRLKTHMQTHTGYKPYKCSECGKCFGEIGTLNIHMRIHTGSKPYKCAECSKCFRRKDHLRIHMRLHTGPKPECSECSKTFSVNEALKRHMQSHTCSKPYKCSECGKCFRQKGDLKRHTRTHTGYKPYKCSECSKTFGEIGALNIHMKKHTGYKPFKCSECGKCFFENGALNRHMRSHTGYKPFKCSECSKFYGERSSLNRHMRTHAVSKP